MMMLALAVVVAPGARAYGKENWQIGFAGTGVAPTTGFGFGFWGWCTFGGGVSSGTTGDCEFSQYVHFPSGGGVTCQVSIEVTGWTNGGTFVISGTARVVPASATTVCLSIFPGSASFSGLDTGIPGVPGQFNFGTFDGLKGEFVIQVTQLPS